MERVFFFFLLKNVILWSVKKNILPSCPTEPGTPCVPLRPSIPGKPGSPPSPFGPTPPLMPGKPQNQYNLLIISTQP